VWFDEEIAPVLDFLSWCSIPTVYSCQGDPGVQPGDAGAGYIMFASPDALDRGTKLLADAADGRRVPARNPGPGTGDS
jgi:hypothetical protein